MEELPFRANIFAVTKNYPDDMNRSDIHKSVVTT